MSHFKNLINPPKLSLPTCHCNYCFNYNFFIFHFSKHKLQATWNHIYWWCMSCSFVLAFVILCVFSVELQENRTLKPPPDTTTATTAQANTQARAGALMDHRLAWVGHHTGGFRSEPTVHPCPLRWGRLWVAHQQHTSVTTQ